LLFREQKQSKKTQGKRVFLLEKEYSVEIL